MPQTSPPLTVPPELANTYWGSLIAAPATRPTNGGRVSQVASNFQGGTLPPRADQLSPGMQRQLFNTGGTSVTEEDGQKLAASGWTYGKPAPEGFVYDPNGVLHKPPSGWKKVGRVAGVAIPLAATIATAGAASPWLAASVGGAAALAGAKLQGATWKQALIAGGLGAAAGGLNASGASSGVKIAGQTGIGAAGGAANGGGLRGALAGGATAAVAASAGAKAPKGGAPVATPTAATSPSLQNYMLQTALTAGVVAASGGNPAAIAAAAGSGALGAYTGQTNTQAALQAGTTLASRLAAGAQAAGQTMGNAAAAREVGRQNETNNLVSQDQQRLQAEIAAETARVNRGTLDVTQQRDARDERADAYKQALRSALALNAKDVTANRPAGTPTISFSNSPRVSQLGAQGRAAAETVNQQALDRLTNPHGYTPLPEMETFTPSELPKASGVDTALGIGGALASGLAAFQQNQQGNQQSALIAELLKRSRAQADAGVTPPAAPVAPAKPAPTYDDEPWLGGY